MFQQTINCDQDLGCILDEFFVSFFDDSEIYRCFQTKKNQIIYENLNDTMK